MPFADPLPTYHLRKTWKPQTTPEGRTIYAEAGVTWVKTDNTTTTTTTTEEETAAGVEKKWKKRSKRTRTADGSLKTEKYSKTEEMVTVGRVIDMILAGEVRVGEKRKWDGEAGEEGEGGKVARVSERLEEGEEMRGEKRKRGRDEGGEEEEEEGRECKKVV